MPPIEPGDDRWPARKERLLADVYSRGTSMRHQRQLRIALAVTVAVVLLVAVPALALQDSSSKRAVHTVGEPPTTTAETVPEVIAIPDTTTTTALTTTTAAPSTTTTALVCRNSYNPKCGDFRWDPQPVNQPATASVTFSPANPKTGDTVTFRVIAEDPDADQIGPSSCMPVNFGSGEVTCSIPSHAFCEKPPRGPWTPPAAGPSRTELSYTYVYTQPGTYTAEFNVSSSPFGLDLGCFPDPYGSTAGAKTVVPVTGPPLTTTTVTQ